MPNPSLLILPGDGIGPEVMTEVRKVIDWYGRKRGLVFDVSEDLVGGAAYDAHGTPLTDALDKVLLHPIGGVVAFMLVMVSGGSLVTLAISCLVLGGLQVVVSTFVSPILGGVTIAVLAAVVLRLRPEGFARA